MLSGDKLALYPRVVVELGMGDGRLLGSLARADNRSLYIGIEIDETQCGKARSQLSAENIMLLHGSFEDFVPTLPDCSVDMFMAVLPDPGFIDRGRYNTWKPFYARLLFKLKRGGTFQLVTELTDDLLQPVSDDSYHEWTAWLMQTFASLGFTVAGLHDGAPPEYSTRCLDQFRGDTQRIRIVTMNLTKP